MPIKKLDQNTINQISAGEVVERPASVVKELLDNSIDAGATKITIRIKNGGMSMIEVEDNGCGINRDELLLAFDAHTTSKIQTLEDLNNLITMGFRGEALSTIKAVSEVSASSKTEGQDVGYAVDFFAEKKVEDRTGDISKNEDISVRKTARETGTTVTVTNIFQLIPARLKYLKTDKTEHRYILSTVLPYFLIYPKIHFIFENDGKVQYNLPPVDDIQDGIFSKIRLKDALKDGWTTDPIPFFYDGEGLSVTGFVAHPKFNSKSVLDTFIFINGRPIKDRGIMKSVLQGFDRFMPYGQKVPFCLSLKLRPELVDVNVHPRKEEVRFANPYRIYSSIEQAVRKGVERAVGAEFKNESYSSDDSDNSVGYSRLRSRTASSSKNFLFDREVGESYSRDTSSNKATNREIRFDSTNRVGDVHGSLEFSKNILRFGTIGTECEGVIDKESVSGSSEIPKLNGKISNVRSLSQLFNKYIVVEFEDRVWVVDQHAAAERVTFEKLKKNLEKDNKSSQKLMLPEVLKLNQVENEFVLEHVDFFNKLGFEVEKGQSDNLVVNAIPSELLGADVTQMFKSIFEDEDFQQNMKKEFEKLRDSVIATMACHTSVRTGQPLKHEEMKYLIESLLLCENPYSCPHGRPAVWVLVLNDIDKHFYRTY